MTPRRLLTIAVLVVGALVARHIYPVLHQGFEIKRIVDMLIKLPIAVLLVAVFTRSFANVTPKVHRILMELGNLTYAVYMVHISVQLVLVQSLYGRGGAFFNTLTFFAIYIAVSLMVGLAAYHWFEVPAQSYLRSLFKSKARLSTPQFSVEK
jgi:peptidoglycan/LPS O-acetylase OafA/YrhL